MVLTLQKNNILINVLITNNAPYSPIKNNAKDIEEYSTKYPATNSVSASGKIKWWSICFY